MFYLLLLFTAPAFATSEFEGTWDKVCTNGVKRTEVVRGNTATLHEDYYSDSICKIDAVIRVSSEGTFTMPSDQAIDFMFARVLVTPLREATTRNYNARAACGRETWVTNQPMDVTGEKCTIFGAGLAVNMPSAGRMVYGIWKVEGDALFLGKLSAQFNGATPERRPREFDPVPYRKR